MTDARTQTRFGPREILFLAAAAYCLTGFAEWNPWATAPIALAIGIALALLGLTAFEPESKRLSRILIQASVVLLGFSISLSDVARAGLPGMVFAAATIALVFVLGFALRRLLATDRQVSSLLTAGTAICGGSAIAATGTVIGASSASISVATAVVFLLNAGGVYAYPLIGRALDLSQAQFGAWAAVGIHDVAGVVAAAKQYGDAALAEATVIKLTRVLWIVPVAVVLGRMAQAGTAAGGASAKRPAAPIPWFVALFLVACAARTAAQWALGEGEVAPVAAHLKDIAKAAMTLALFLIGTGLSRSALRQAGWRPLLQGLLMWIAVSIAALAAVRAMVP
ncbi:MAG: putative sulfate exporter family transporter [Phycisphaeraceae bacterium]|nr:putative sulfate exporter family transporter [Phycisphaeraceae bacterium]MBX3406928.1 putative sulfate exporter family transporter [Phycisphaeraceae bacterium]